MKKKLILVALSLFFFSLTSIAQQSIKISGNVKFYDPGFSVSVFQRSGSAVNVLAETVVDDNGNYSLTLPIESPGIYTVDCGRWQNVNIWGDDEDLKIDFRGKDTAKIVIKNPPYVYINGGKNNDLMNLLNYESYSNYQLMIAISQAVYRNVEVDSVKTKLSSAMYAANDANYRAHIQYLVEHHTDTPSCLAAISYLRGDSYAPIREKALAELEKNFPNYKPISDYRAKELQDKIDRERMKIGSPAPLFAYPAPKGKEKIGPSTYKGKILLIDFWASWCGPCKGEIPNLKKVYEQYKDQGVEFLSVSIDAKKADWEKALKAEDMPWPQLLAPDAGKELMQLYQFSGIPFIVLLDEEGNLAAKFLRGEAVEKEIKKLLNK